jgi:hypothetical protein
MQAEMNLLLFNRSAGTGSGESAGVDSWNKKDALIFIDLSIATRHKSCVCSPEKPAGINL